jgi:CRP/FNR family transcriptional regulator
MCLTLGLDDHEVVHVDKLITQRLKVKKGAALYRTADPLRSLYGKDRVLQDLPGVGRWA